MSSGEGGEEGVWFGGGVWAWFCSAPNEGHQLLSLGLSLVVAGPVIGHRGREVTPLETLQGEGLHHHYIIEV